MKNLFNDLSNETRPKIERYIAELRKKVERKLIGNLNV